MAIVIDALLNVARRLVDVCVSTVMAGVIAVATKALLGCWLKASLVALCSVPTAKSPNVPALKPAVEVV
jgi:hypothetical protein